MITDYVTNVIKHELVTYISCSVIKLSSAVVDAVFKPLAVLHINFVVRFM